MNDNSPRAVALSDLAALTMRGNVAFAVRCAQRLRPFFDPPANAPRRREQVSAVDGAIRLAIAFCQGAPMEAGRAEAAVGAVTVVAEETGEDTRFAGFAALRAAEAVLNAEEFLRKRTDDSLIMEVVAAAFGAGRVLAANSDNFALEKVVATLCADTTKLLSLAHGAAKDLGPPIDLSERGPLGGLWPEGVPFGFALGTPPAAESAES